MAYDVFYDENGSYMDPDARSGPRTYATAEEALAACRAMVEADLDEVMEPGAGPGGTLTRWKFWGRDPFIVATDGSERVTFSAWSYAAERCGIRDDTARPPS